ncbi:hypothetical protein SAMN02910358_01292 [Lachnospiraceae bacterium XBB1006]|nr:hypothetical protein SAMN02910358_01292 [Lachnospiraceae bacterium XBB1006]
MKKATYLFLGILIAIMFVFTGCGKESDYKEAISLYEDGKFAEAATKFTELGDYEKSAEYVIDCDYNIAKGFLQDEKYEEAIKIFETLKDYKDSSEKLKEAKFGLMKEKYSDVIDALNGNKWFFNGGSDTILNMISFEDTQAIISQVYFDGNGKHENGSNNYDCAIDDKNIVLTMADESELKIEYKLSDGKIVLGGKNTYLNSEEVERGIQGYWKCRTSFADCKTDSYVSFDNGKVTSEEFSEARGYTDGSYYYYGPYTGKYAINDGGFDTEMMHGKNWFFNIIDGKVTILNYDHVCKKTKKFPGEDGYDF